MERGLHEESVVGIEVESLYLGQLLVAVAEENAEVVGLLALCLQKVAVGERLGEGA